MTGSWVVVVPAKRFGAAKTRCAGLDPAQRGALARAMLTDVVGALLRVPRVRAVVVATADPEVAGTALAAGAAVAASARGSGLNQEVTDALTGAAAAVPDARLAVAMADLAGADPADFETVLATAEGRSRAIVPDADGTGTTMVLVGEAGGFKPFLGRDSRRRFLADGFHELPVTAPGLRRDVDTVEQLISLGAGRLGEATRAWVASSAPSLPKTDPSAS
ncbi:MAG TPA: 2-phospho-L-lactate guanylyltransferase [Micromonospora sp.]